MNSNDKIFINVLLVEDNPGDILLMKEVLSENDDYIKLTIIKDGAEAMHYLKNNTTQTLANLPDLVILDLNLPKKNGREILNNIRNDDALKDLPVIIFTSSDAEEDVSICKQLKVIKYYKKPIDFDEYISTIKEIEKTIDSTVNSKNNNNNLVS